MTIGKHPDDVAAYVLDPTTMPHYSAVLYEVEPPADQTFLPGGRLKGRMHVLGLSLEVEGEMVEFDPAGRRATIVVRPAGAAGNEQGFLEHNLWVEDLGDTSLLHFRNRLTLPDWVPEEAISDGLVRHLFDQTANFALANIRYFLETEAEPAIHSFVETAGTYLNPSASASHGAWRTSPPG